jgi:acetyltransferase-like isoleucine patch superfamily enzyme
MKLLRYLKRKLFPASTQTIGPVIQSGIHHNGIFLPRVRISDSTVISVPEKLLLSDNVFVGHYNFIEASHGITIEEGVQLTNYISVLTHSSHVSIRLYGKNYLGKKDPIGYKVGPVKIGQFTFVGPHVTIMPETNIGKGCLVAAYAYVKGDFPDFAIIAGNPAKVIGDTRNMDKPYLDAHPELQVTYSEWANR